MECHLEESGTDCCENYFSCLGQWTGNKHNYTYADMTRNRDHCTRLEQIRCNSDGPKFAKPHPKSESIWKQQYESGYTKCNLKSYPAVGEELKAWKKGIVEARKLAISVGMSPASSNRIDSVLPFTKENDDAWFFNPFHFKGNTFQDLSSFPTDGADPLDVDFEMLSKDADSDGTNETEDVSNQEYLPNSEALRNVMLSQDAEAEVLEPPQHQENQNEEVAEATTPRISSQVTIPNSNGKLIYKSTLIQLLNDDPKLSHDSLGLG
ncbi:uncharacterized protein [Clytia hemisphaerica]|uniref:uncharacterized protein n=1 Tax=Clytia hemisphaerica TaxID=252671 RepID=UPI0034D75C6F